MGLGAAGPAVLGVGCASSSGETPTTDASPHPKQPRLHLSTTPAGATVKAPDGTVVCAATPCDIDNTDTVVTYSVVLSEYKQVEMYSGPDFHDQAIGLVGEGEPGFVGCDPQTVCVAPLVGVSSLKAPFEHCAPELAPKTGDTWTMSGFTPSGTREKRAATPDVCCYLAGSKCPEKGRPLRASPDDEPTHSVFEWLDETPQFVSSDAALADQVNRVGTAIAALEQPVREMLSQSYVEIAAAEHASIASFARFTLELVALGAPDELLALTQRAALDEIEHAAIMSYFAGAAVGRRLARGRVRAPSLNDVIDVYGVARATFRDGCVNETIGALSLARAAERAASPAMAEILRRVAEDEARHAELAWRTIAWLASADQEAVRAALEHELGRLSATVVGAGQVSALAGECQRWGIYSPDDVAVLSVETIREVIEPCARALLATGLSPTRLPTSREERPSTIA
ncbi:MAG: ferritin-like domain-containing protein [Polyangiaceae bacterium]